MTILRLILQQTLNNSGTSRRHKLIGQIRKVASSDGKKDLDIVTTKDITMFNSQTEERAKDNKMIPSNSSSNTFSAHDSYLSEKKQKNTGYQSPGLPYDGSNAKLIKKPKRRTFTTGKKKIGSMNINSGTEKSISPSIKLKNKNKDKLIPFPHTNSTKMTRGNIMNDSPNSSFTIEGGKNSMDGKNLIDEFNQKYAASEKSALNNDDSDPSDSETNKTNDTAVDGNVAIIHVIDETKKRKQDFK